MNLKQFIALVVVLITIWAIVLYSYLNRHPTLKVNIKENKVKQEYTKFKVPEFKHLIVKPSAGMVIISIRPFEFSTMEINNNFKPMVNFETSGDTLVIYSSKPDEQGIRKHINLYTKNLESINTSLCQIYLNGLKEENLKVISEYDNYKIRNCTFGSTTIQAKDQSQFFLNSSNTLDNLSLDFSDDCKLQSLAMIETALIKKGNKELIQLPLNNTKNVIWKK